MGKCDLCGRTCNANDLEELLKQFRVSGILIFAACLVGFGWMMAQMF